MPRQCDGVFDCKNKIEVRQHWEFSNRYWCAKCWDEWRNEEADTWSYKCVPRYYTLAEILDA